MPYSRRAKYFHHRRHDPEDFVEEGMGSGGEESQFVNVPLSHTDYQGTQYDPDVDRAIIGVHEDDVGKEGPRGGKVTRIQAIQELKDPLERKKRKAERREVAAARGERELSERIKRKRERAREAGRKVKEQVAYEKGARTNHQREARERMSNEARKRESKQRLELIDLRVEKEKAIEERRRWEVKREEAERKIARRGERRREKAERRKVQRAAKRKEKVKK